MRLLVACLALFLPTTVLAQAAPAESSFGVPPSAEPPPAPEPPPPPPPPPPVAPLAVEADAAARAAFDAQLKLADSWVAFETERDVHTRAAERFFYPAMLAIEAGVAVAYAAALEDATDTSRILAGVSAGLALGAMVPTILSKSRGGRRAWFAGGAAAFSLGAAATLMTAVDKGDDGLHTARWGGAAVAVQGLAMLPVGFIEGFPEESDYEAYRKLPASERPAAAARLLTRIDRFEHRAAAIGIASMLANAAVLALGSLTAENRDDARALGGLCLVPLATMSVVFAPRLFVRNRLDRFTFGETPRKLPLNGW